MALMKITEPGASFSNPSRKNVIGIDLGTTNSLVATVKQGKPEVISDKDGYELLPSVVYYGHKERVYVGSDALEFADSNPVDTLMSVKRFLGREKESIASEASMHKLTPEGDDINFVTASGIVNPVQASAEILSTLSSRARDFFQEDIEGAVITVPAYFNDAQRQATKDAARLAGINVIRLLNEPTAAALAYGLESKEQGVIAVYDLGGGTFDISILRLHAGVFEVIATGGDTSLGGDDIDLLIYNWLAEEIGVADPDFSVRRRMLAAVKVAKEALSDSEAAVIDTSFLDESDKCFEITQAILSSIIEPLVMRTILACRRCLKDAGVTSMEIDNVVMVGGSTRIVSIQKSISEFFGREPLAGIDPDNVVAIGAAQQANILVGNDSTNEVLLIDVTPLSLGIETMGGLVEKIIHRNTAIPVTRAQEFTTYKDGQTGLKLHVVQGERELVVDCRSLANFELFGIPPMVAGSARIEVTFQVDADGLLNVTAREKTTGREASVNVQPALGLDESEISAMLEKSFSNAESDINARKMAEQRVHSNQLLDCLSAAIEQDGDSLLSDSEKNDIQLLMHKLENLLISEDFEKIEHATETLAQASESFAMLRMDRSVQAALEGKRLNDLTEEAES